MTIVIGLIARGCLTIAALCFGGFVLMILAQVGYRYLGVSMVFSEEAARVLNVYSVFFGLVFVVFASADVRINLIDRFMASRPALRMTLRGLYLVLAAGFFTVLTVGSFLLAQSNWSWPLPSISFMTKGHVYVAPFLGGLMSLIIVLHRIYLLALGCETEELISEDVE